MVPEIVEKYIYLVQSFAEAGPHGLSWKELQEKWESRYGVSYPRRSFLNHRTGIGQIFGITISCDRSTNRYHIEREESAVDKRDATDFLINTFTVNSLLTLGKERLSGRVAVEDIPSGQIWLTTLMQAMLEGNVLLLEYQKYLREETELRTIHPYAVKEFAKRWYVVAYSEENGSLRTYALDRIASLRSTGEHFKMPKGFDVEALFESSYGIYLPEEGQEPMLVTLRATPRESAYLKDLPLHPSQTLVEENGDGAVFALRLIPNPNFTMELLRRADRLEVLSPESLREEVKQALKKALQIYEN